MKPIDKRIGSSCTIALSKSGKFTYQKCSAKRFMEDGIVYRTRADVTLRSDSHGEAAADSRCS